MNCQDKFILASICWVFFDITDIYIHIYIYKKNKNVQINKSLKCYSLEFFLKFSTKLLEIFQRITLTSYDNRKIPLFILNGFILYCDIYNCNRLITKTVK